MPGNTIGRALGSRFSSRRIVNKSTIIKTRNCHFCLRVNVVPLSIAFLMFDKNKHWALECRKLRHFNVNSHYKSTRETLVYCRKHTLFAKPRNPTVSFPMPKSRCETRPKFTGKCKRDVDDD